MLTASGTADEPVVYTSIGDSEYGADIGEYATSTTTSLMEWNRPISFFNHGSGFFSHFIVRHGGGLYCNPGCVQSPMLFASRGNISLWDSTLSDAVEAIHTEDASHVNINRSLFLNLAGAFSVSGSTLFVRGSNFLNVDTGIRSFWPYLSIPDATDNWWGDVRGPKTYTDTECGGSWVYGDASFSPWLATRPDVGATSTDSHDSIESSTSLRAPVPVLVVPGILGSMEWKGSWILDPILHTYDNLVATLKSNGYVTDKTLFTFPYDWRSSNIETAKLLKDKIDDIKTAQNCSLVDVVAHSMGGLVARSYIQSPKYSQDVRNLIFLGTPHKGAPEDYLAWEGGSINTSLSGRLISIVLGFYSLGQGYSSSFDYIRRFPVSSVQELLPTYDYLHDAAASSTALLPFPSGYPRNPFLEPLNASFISSIGNLKTSVGRLLNIVGDSGTETVATIEIKKPASTTTALEWSEGEAKSFSYDRGDGTVPFSSASLDSTDSVVEATHTDIPTEAESLVVEALTGHQPLVTVHHSKIVNMLTAAINSLADILITSPHGSRVGRDSKKGIDVAEIPDSFYSGSDRPAQFISIPNPEPGQYTFEILGKADGDYKLEIQNISEATSSIHEFSGATATGSATLVELNFNQNLEVPSQTVASSAASFSSSLIGVPRSSSKSVKIASPFNDKAMILFNENPADFADLYVKYSDMLE